MRFILLRNMILPVGYFIDYYKIMRKIFFVFALLSTLMILGLSLISIQVLWIFLLTGPLIVLGIYDMIQSSHSIARNFPVVGRLRFYGRSQAKDISVFRRKRYQWYAF
jgi:hypothetical protein